MSAYADWIDPGRVASMVTDAVTLGESGNAGWLDRLARGGPDG